MANDRDDFAPEIRNSAWWASDTRRAVNGNLIETILIKQGKKEAPDLSDVEAVQMGHVMQPIIIRLASERLNAELVDADYMLAHPTEHWLKSHFDARSSDGTFLVEAKNYNANKRKFFDPDTNRVPTEDYYQCLHEAVVHNVDKVYLAVLFGGQEFHTFELNFTQEDKEHLIKQASEWWAHVQLNALPEPTSVEDANLAFPEATEDALIATNEIEYLVEQLKVGKEAVKEIEAKVDIIETKIKAYMANRAELRTFSGETLVTWKNSKPTKRFSTDLFKQSMPDLYEKYVIEQLGSRRFLVK